MTAYAEVLGATRDPKYARRFVQLADRVLAQRDDHRKVADAYRGKIVPAWSSTKYTKNKRYAWAVHTGMLASVGEATSFDLASVAGSIDIVPR